jgi:lysophospholipase L1-like esterase
MCAVVRRGSLLVSAALILLAGAGAARGQVGVIAFGDSITEGTGDDPARPEKGYPPRLQALLVAAGVQATVKNEGKGGYTTADGITHIDEVLAAAPSSTELILLMMGTNDISQGIGFETTLFNLREMARKSQQRGLGVVHATCIPRWPSAWADYGNVVNLRLAENIRDIAGTANRDLADPFEVFATLPNLFATYYAPLDPDPVGHPNAAGYDQLAQTFFNVLRHQDHVAPVPGITSPLHAAEGVPNSGPISVDVWDFGAGIDLANTRLIVNGTDVGVSPSGTTKHAQLAYTPATPLTGVVRVGLRTRDLAAPANASDRDVVRFIAAGTTVLVGDLDRSGRVDGADLVMFARRFGARSNEPRYQQQFDFNTDNVIDGSDLAMMAANFGKSSF